MPIHSIWKIDKEFQWRRYFEQRSKCSFYKGIWADGLPREAISYFEECYLIWNIESELLEMET